MPRTFASVLFVSLVIAFSAGAADLKVATYNVGLLKVFGSDYVPLVDRRAAAAPAELARYASASQPDVILLEEVWRDAYARDIERALAPLGYATVYPPVHTILGLSSGLLLAVKAPIRILDWSFAPFTRTTLVDSFARKGVLQATLETADGTRLAFVGTHTVALDTDNGIPKDKSQVDAHAAQAEQVLSAIRSRSAAGSLPVLVLGDFNVGPGYADQAYRRIADAPGIEDVAVAVSPSSPPITWDPGNPLVKYGSYPNEPPATIDHVFVRGGGSLAWKASAVRLVFQDPVQGIELVPSKGAAGIPSPLSDHYGLEAELELSGSP